MYSFAYASWKPSLALREGLKCQNALVNLKKSIVFLTLLNTDEHSPINTSRIQIHKILRF